MTALMKSLFGHRISTLRLMTFTAAACAAFFVSLAPAGPAQAQAARTSCGDRAAVLDRLAARYAEAPVNMGLTSTGAVLEILASDQGTWTVLVTTPQGVTCMMAAGEHWEPVERKKVDVATSTI